MEYKNFALNSDITPANAKRLVFNIYSDTLYIGDDNPRFMNGGLYKLASSSYNTQYFPHDNLWGYIMIIGDGGIDTTGAIIFATDGIWVGQSEHKADVLTWTNLADYRDNL